VALGFAALIVRPLQASACGGVGIVAIYLGMLFWNGNYFRRNRPGHYRPEALPPLLMPGG
jgi:hypothetical protein